MNTSILCVLSTLQKRFLKSPRIENNEHHYIVNNDPTALPIKGIQSNEPAIRYLLNTQRPITEICYLRSPECRIREHAFSDDDLELDAIDDNELRAFIRDARPDNDDHDDSSNMKSDRKLFSTEQFFIGRTKKYCKDTGLADIDELKFYALEYNPDNPAGSLSAIIDFFGKHQNNIAIDTTGGPRDAATLMTFAIEVLKNQASHCTISDIVYSSYNLGSNSGLISTQMHTFNLIDLINAVRAFTDYGRADELVNFFNDEKAFTPQTRTLCKCLKEFSDALSICQIEHIEEAVVKIFDAIDDTQTTLDAAKTSYRKAFLALDEREIKTSYQESQAVLDENRIVRGELLFNSLIPTIQRSFEDAGITKELTDNPIELIPGIISWCNERHMIQQALCIYRERIAEYLNHVGYFDIIETNLPVISLRRDRNGECIPETRNESIKELCSRCYPDIAEGIIPNRNFNYFSICVEFEKELRRILLYYGYLRGVRNMVMHIDITANDYTYKLGRRFLKAPVDGSVPNSTELQEIIRQSIGSIVDPKPLNDEEWRRVFPKRARKEYESSGQS